MFKLIWQSIKSCCLPLLNLGYVATVILPLIEMDNITESVIDTPLITASIDIHQGSPTSCLQFVIFVNDLKKMIKEGLDQMVF